VTRLELEKMKEEYKDVRFTSKESVRQYLSTPRIECLICHKTYLSLGSHLATHGLTNDEYREIFNIPWRSALASTSTREAMSDSLTERRKTDDRLCVNPAVLVDLHRNKPKRRFRDYDIDRVTDMVDQEAVRKRNESKEKVILILDEMEKSRCPIGVALRKLNMTNYSLLPRTIEYFPELKDRYDRIRAAVRYGITGKFGLNYDEIRRQVLLLVKEGLTNKEISERLGIGKTTVKRALVRQDAFSNCVDTDMEEFVIEKRRLEHLKAVRPPRPPRIPKPPKVYPSLSELKEQFRSKRFTSRKAAKTYVAQEQITCLICEQKFDALDRHLKHAHGITNKEYHEIFNIPWTLSLVGDKARRTRAERIRRRIAERKENPLISSRKRGDGNTRKQPLQSFEETNSPGYESDYVRQMKEATRIAATEILDCIEKYQLPATVVCELPGIKPIATLHHAKKYFPEINERYEQLKLMLKNLREKSQKKNKPNQ